MARSKPPPSLSVVALDPTRSRVQPPSDLSKEEKEGFRTLIESVNHNHFAQQDVPLIVAYVQSMIHSRRASADLSGKFASRDTLAQWQAATKMMATLATRLRIAPQSRYDAKTAERNARYATPPGRKPWERRNPTE